MQTPQSTPNLIDQQGSIFHAPFNISTKPIDYTDPVDTARNVFHGIFLKRTTELQDHGAWKSQPLRLLGIVSALFLLHLPGSIILSPYYRVLVHGPSRQSISPENFTSVVRTNNPTRLCDSLSIMGHSRPWGYGSCTVEDLRVGRYLSVNASPEFAIPGVNLFGLHFISKSLIGQAMRNRWRLASNR